MYFDLFTKDFNVFSTIKLISGEAAAGDPLSGDRHGEVHLVKRTGITENTSQTQSKALTFSAPLKQQDLTVGTNRKHVTNDP